jgi:hypothetical protein
VDVEMDEFGHGEAIAKRGGEGNGGQRRCIL